MDHGVLEQAGSLREIHDRPCSPYIARFTGGQNVLRGTVETVTGGHVIAGDAKGAPHDLSDAVDFKPGDAANFSIGRDKTQISEEAGAATTGVSDKVTNIECRGCFVKVAPETGTPDEFIADLDDDGYFAAPTRVGQEVCAHRDMVLNHVLRGVSDSTGNPVEH